MMFMKKSCAILLSLLVLISVVGFSVTAEETGYNGGEYTYSLSENKATITDYSYHYEDPDLTDSIVIPEKLDGYTVVAIADNAFEELDYFKSIKLADTIETIGNNAFRDCTELEEVVLSKNLKSIGEYAFASCEELKSIDIPASVESIGDYAFWFCINLSSINVDENNAAFTSKNGVLFNKNKTMLLRYPAKYGTEKYEIPAGVTEICADAFSANIIVKEIVVPDSVQKIGISAFNNCRALEKINIPAGIKEIPSNVFYYCTALDNVVVPDSVTKIDDRCFAGCHSLKNIVMSKNIESLGTSAFYECVSLEKIEFGDKLTVIGEVAFDHCVVLETFDIPASVETIGAQAFGYCKALKSITVPSGVKSIGGNVFYHCVALETMGFEEGVTEIPEGAMINCISLKSVTLPTTLKKIGVRAFLEVSQLTDVYYAGTQEDWKNVEIAEDNEPLQNAEIHFSSNGPEVRGDVNSDRAVNASDALLVLKHAVKRMELTGKALEKADVNKDSSINASDALIILRIAVGIDDSIPLNKQDVVGLYNGGIEKAYRAKKCVMSVSTDFSAEVNKVLVNGDEDPEITKMFEDMISSTEYEDLEYIFINGQTEDGEKSEDILSSLSTTTDKVKTATAVPYGEGYKITLDLYPQSETLDSTNSDLGDAESQTTELSEIEIVAVTDGQGRVVMIDFHTVGNVKATTVEEEITVYMDFDAEQRDVFTFTY
ncbi:MAG: leucine-rich repeat protein [Clostridia bacterium]|nr:leucine-rich repeat protein [Clostridia bacterium]